MLVLVRKKQQEQGEQMTMQEWENIPEIFRSQLVMTPLEVEKPESVKAIEKEVKEKK